MLCSTQVKSGWTVWAFLCLAIVGLIIPPNAAVAQKSKPGGFGGFGIPQIPGGSQVSFAAKYELEKGTRNGRLHVTADVQDGWHMYSVTQPPGGPKITELTVGKDLIQLTGPFTPNVAAEIHEEDVFPGIPIEEHYGSVTWTAPFQLTKDVKPEETPIRVSVDGQVCITGGSCIQVNQSVDAKFDSYYGGTKTVESLRVPGSHAVWSARIEPAQVKPGGKAIVRITAQTDKDYHVYRYAGDEEINFRTLIVASKKSGLKFGTPETKVPLVDLDAAGVKAQYYEGPVEWSVPIEIPKSAGIGEHPIEFQVGFWTCNDRSCDAPKGISLQGVLTVAETSGTKPAAMSVAEIPFTQVAESPQLNKWIDLEKKSFGSWWSGKGLEPWMVFAALAGGFVLNLMPCVLPVIGLKLMSFVSQSGNDHRRVVSLNLSYVLGILAVMLVLALFNVFAKSAGEAFGWGTQFQHLQFQVPMAVLLFAMSLSFLGVWEIPIPGFATSSKSGELMEKEGLWGAFLKGILTTILATPCSGPFLGTLFGLTLTLSVPAILMLYALVGLGLGLPYIALCFWPGFIKVLPKPGAWMETLKQILAFPLLLTVVYFVHLINADYRIATLILLIVVWFACWLIGRVPAYADASQKSITWGSAVAATVLGAVIAFNYFGGPTTHQLPWIPFKEATLAQYRQEGKTVMVEFTAKWCPTCQWNMVRAIDRPLIAELVKKNDVIPLLADWSEPSSEIENKVRELESNSIPLLAIYPADPAADPIILRDVISERQLLDALEKAGPSNPGPTEVGSSSKLTSHQ